jgi:zinc protease
MLKRRSFFIIALSSIFSGCALVSNIDNTSPTSSISKTPIVVSDGVASFELDNGLKVIVKQDHRAPVVVHQVWYKVGSNYEHNGITGVSHMLEHMMFKGTKSVKVGDFSKKVSKMGGQENAFTSSDYTAYYQVVGKQHLESVMQLEADRMRNLLLDEEQFQKERDVVTEERRLRTDDNPSSKLYEQFNAIAFLNSPQRIPVIGWMQDIRNWQLQDLQSWYEQWYAPNNATLVVVGDVDPVKVKEYAEKYYGIHKKSNIMPPKPQLEIPQIGKRAITIKGATKLPSVIMGFQVPSLVTASNEDGRKEAYALDVLGDILDGDDSARLTKFLVRGSKKLASVEAYYRATSRLKTSFSFSMTPSAGVTPEQAQQQVWQEIKKLQTQKVTKKELNRVLAQAEAAYVYRQDSVNGQAMVLGSLASVGLPISTLDNWIDNIRKVTPEEIQAVAKKYFTQDTLTLGILLPNGEKVKKLRGASSHGGLR